MKETPLNRICFTCKKSFYVPTWKLRLGNAKYCSRACTKTRIPIKCEWCKKPFMISPSQFKKRPHPHCSTKCYGLSKRQRIVKICPICHKSFETRLCESNKYIACSQQCSKIRKMGTGNSHWKGGITPLRELLREYLKGIQWAKQVKERDYYTCQMCGKKGGELHADHYPISFATIVQTEHITSLADANKNLLLNDLSNGRTLCITCHRTTFRKKVMST